MLGARLPDTLSGLRTVGPCTLLIAALVLTWWFNRGRAFVLALSLLGAFAANGHKRNAGVLAETGLEI